MKYRCDSCTRTGQSDFHIKRHASSYSELHWKLHKNGQLVHDASYSTRSKCSFLKDLLLKGKSIKRPSNNQKSSLSLFLLLSYSKSYESSFLSIYSIQDNLLRILFLPKKIKKHFPFFFFTSLYISFSISNPTRWQQLSLEKKEKSTDQVTGYKSREPSKPLFPKRKESRDCASKIRSENQSVELYVQFEENNSTVRRNVRILMLKFSK